MHRYQIEPTVSERKDLLSRCGPPSQSWSEGADTDAFAKAAVRYAKNHGLGSIRTVDLYWASRTTAGSSLGATGIYWDYYLSDSDGRIVGVFRRLVD